MTDCRKKIFSLNRQPGNHSLRLRPTALRPIFSNGLPLSIFLFKSHYYYIRKIEKVMSKFVDKLNLLFALSILL